MAYSVNDTDILVEKELSELCFGCSTSEVKETRSRLGRITWSIVTNLLHISRIGMSYVVLLLNNDVNEDSKC